MKKSRIWEIDLFRALAIVLMMTFHLAYDLNEFGGLNVNYESPEWFWVGKSSAILFIFISGISSGFSRNPVKRGIQVLLCGMLLTIGSFFMFPDEYIRFGILHFLGLSMILYPLLRKFNSRTLLTAAVVSLIAGFYFDKIVVDTWMLIPFGLMYKGFNTLDYYPIFPYISIYLMGILCFRMLYKEKRSIFNFSINLGFIETVSENSLLIYLVHQPVFYAVILALKIIIKK